MDTNEVTHDYNNYIKGFVDSHYSSEFLYRNGVHLLFIRETSHKYQLCGLGTGFHPVANYNNFDVYFVTDDKMACIKEFERFISLLLLHRRFDMKSVTELEFD